MEKLGIAKERGGEGARTIKLCSGIKTFLYPCISWTALTIKQHGSYTSLNMNLCKQGIFFANLGNCKIQEALLRKKDNNDYVLCSICVMSILQLRTLRLANSLSYRHTEVSKPQF